MCNLYTQTKSVDQVARLFRDIELPLSFPEGIPNLGSRDICITDPGAIVRAGGGAGEFDLVMRRWSWPGSNGKPVYNFRSEGREFPSGRCLIVADGFFEFTTSVDRKQKRKDRWLFTSRDEPLIAIAGLVRDAPAVGEAFTMLTTEPGPDVAPYHGRQIAVLPMNNWRRWLDYSAPAAELLRPLPGGSLEVRRVGA
ncbi:MAG TPA: SOS response-associated peptidase [Sphingomicrobium sp.]|nr:SOS response-associated peptidase [Sphingomicrobium sp.]